MEGGASEVDTVGGVELREGGGPGEGRGGRYSIQYWLTGAGGRPEGELWPAASGGKTEALCAG